MSSLKVSLKRPSSGKGSTKSSTQSKVKATLDGENSFLTEEKMLAESIYWVRYSLFTRMYKVTYIVLSAYSGILFFVYIPAFKFMLDNSWNSSLNITMFTVYVWMTWLIKPFFGYLCDHYPICNKRITPYIVIASLINILVLSIASRLDLSKNYWLFMVVIITMFTCFSLIDSVARKLPSS